MSNLRNQTLMEVAFFLNRFSTTFKNFDMAPDKIYLYQEKPKDSFDENWHESTASDVLNVEYIRKDLLLEWAKQEKRNTSIGLSEYDAGHENGRMELLNDLIDKINTL